MSEKHHVVVVGGGIVGVSTAYFLTRHPLFASGSVEVTLVEEHELAGGASGKAGGFLAIDWHGPHTASLATLSYNLHQSLAREHDGAAKWSYRTVESVNAIARARKRTDDAEPEANIALAAAESELEFRPRPPLRGSGRIDWLWTKEQGGSVEAQEVVAGEDTTAQVNPREFTLALWDLAAAAGAKLVKASPVSVARNPSTDAPLSILLSNSDTLLPCTSLVLAAGPWTSPLSERLLSVPLPIGHLPGYSLVIRPTTPASAHAVFVKIKGATSANMTGSPEFFARPDGTIWFGGQNYGPDLPASCADVDEAALTEPENWDKLVAAAKELSREMSAGEIVKKQLCYRPISDSGVPLVSSLNSKGCPGVFVGSGHGPWGITLAPGTGKVLAELVLDGKATSADISALAIERVR